MRVYGAQRDFRDVEDQDLTSLDLLAYYDFGYYGDAYLYGAVVPELQNSDLSSGEYGYYGNIFSAYSNVS